MQWGVISTSTATEVNLPITYTSWYSILLGPINASGAWTASTYENSSSIKTLSSFVLGGTGVNSTSGSSGAYWFTIGY